MPVSWIGGFRFRQPSSYLAFWVNNDSTGFGMDGSVYNWSPSGFGTKFSDPSISTSGNNSVCPGLAWSNKGDYIAFGGTSSGSQYTTVYPWSSSGFGTRFSGAANLPDNFAWGIAFTPTDSHILVSNDQKTTITNVWVEAWPWSSSGWGTRLSSTIAIANSPKNTYGISFHPSGSDVAIPTETSPFMSVFPWSSSGFGTKYSNPATLPPNAGVSIEFSGNGNDIAVGHLNSPFISVYPWSSSGFGTKYSNPASGIGNTAISLSFPGDVIAVGNSSSPRVHVYPWSSSGFGTKFSNPATLPNNVEALDFSNDGTAIITGATATPYARAYPWSSAGFGTVYSDPATAVPRYVQNTKFSPV